MQFVSNLSVNNWHLVCEMEELGWLVFLISVLAEVCWRSWWDFFSPELNACLLFQKYHSFLIDYLVGHSYIV